MPADGGHTEEPPLEVAMPCEHPATFIELVLAVVGANNAGFNGQVRTQRIMHDIVPVHRASHTE